MRVHFFVRTLNEKTGGGSHYNSIAFIRMLRKGGHTVVVHILYPEGNAPPTDIEPVIHQGFGLGHFGERRYLASLLDRYQPDADVFFLYAVEFMWGGALYRKRGGHTPVVVYMDSCIPSLFTTHPKAMTRAIRWYQFKRWPWDRFFGVHDVQHIDQFLPCSPYIGETYKRFGFPKNKFTVLPNVVPNTAAAVVDRSDHDRITVLYVGRLVYIKGVDQVIEAMYRLKHHHARLIIVGDGETRAEIEALISKYTLDATITGWIPEDQVGAYYKEGDIFIHPTRCLDAAPRAVVGALQWGLPVVVPNTGGAAWIAGEAGIVYDVRDPQGMTRALDRVLSDPDLRKNLAAQAKAQTARFEEAAVYPILESVLSAVTHTK